MHFAAQLRAATGYRPREYLLTRRVEHAKSLLTTTDKSLVEVALAVGFSTQAHFSTVFKRISGETPARWRSAFTTEAQPRRPPLHQNWSVAVPASAPVRIWPAARWAARRSKSSKTTPCTVERSLFSKANRRDG
jgi:hypothetical protein